MILGRHIPAVRLVTGALLAAVVLAGCTPQTMRENWRNRVSGETEVHIPEGDYRVAFLPLASPPGAAADAWVYGPGVTAPFTIPEGGVPGLRISRLNGMPMTRADHENAVAAASAGCTDRPGWTPAKAAVITSTIARTESQAYYGTGYLTDGAWVLLGVCK